MQLLSIPDYGGSLREELVHADNTRCGAEAKCAAAVVLANY